MTKSPDTLTSLAPRPQLPANDSLVARLAEDWFLNYCREFAGYDILQGPDHPAISPAILPEVAVRKVIEVSPTN